MTRNEKSGRSAKAPEADWQGTADRARMAGNEQPAPPQEGSKTDLMTAAIIYAFASAFFLGAGVVLAQLGLRTVEPLSGAAISVPSFTLLFLLLSPLILQGEPVVWRGLPIFIAIGLFFPASLTLLTFASNRALGPVITSTLGNLAPLFAVATAVILLHEPLHPPQLLGLVVAVAGAAIITVTRPRDLGHWRSWALLLPLASALVRGVVPPIVKLGLDGLAEPALGLPDRLHHVLAGGADGAAHPQRQLCRAGAARRPVLVRDDRDQQRPERAHAVRRRPQRPDHAGGAAGRDLSAGHGGAERDGAQAHRDHRTHRGGTALTVLGVALVLIG